MFNKIKKQKKIKKLRFQLHKIYNKWIKKNNYKKFRIIFKMNSNFF